MITDFDQIIDRRNTRSVKWDYCLERFDRRDILPMWVADMDFPSPPAVAAAIVQRAGHGVFGYTGVSEQLNEAIVRWMKRRNAWAIEQDWIVHSPGVVTSIITAISAFTEPGDKILIQTPVYHPFFSSILNNGRQLVTNSLKDIGGYYEMDFDDLEKKLAEGVKMLIFCSPHNPVGRVWEPDELKQLISLCSKYNVLIVSDEIHSDLIYKGHKHIPAATVSEWSLLNSVTCISPTKTFNLAGLAESSVIIPHKELRLKFQKALERSGAGMLNIFGLEAAQAAYGSGEPWLEELLDYLSGNLELLTAYFTEKIPSIKVCRTEGTYLSWLDCRGLGIGTEELNRFFTREAGVGLNDGAQFGEEGAGFQRINFACPKVLLLEGLQKVENAVANRTGQYR